MSTSFKGFVIPAKAGIHLLFLRCNFSISYISIQKITYIINWLCVLSAMYTYYEKLC